jgi:hypothetical protein
MIRLGSTVALRASGSICLKVGGGAGEIGE